MRVSSSPGTSVCKSDRWRVSVDIVPGCEREGQWKRVVHPDIQKRSVGVVPETGRHYHGSETFPNGERFRYPKN